MAEKVEILEIETGNSEQTLKELKDQIKELRKELDGCTIGSDKFKSTLDELTTAQDKLKKATKGNTDTNEALEGSYDALVKKMSELKKAWRATADEAERADLGQQIADINDQLKDMDASIGNYQRNVGNYASAFDDVTIKIEDGCMRFDRFNGAARSIIGSFDLVEGGLKAIGVESEEVNNLMDKMQGLMVISNGLTSVKEGVQAFNAMRVATQGAKVAQVGLNTAMKANPIGAIIAVITAAVAALTALVSWMNKAGDSSESLKEKNDQLTESFAKQNDELDYNLRLMKAKGASELQILKSEYEGKLKIAKEAYDEYKKMFDEANDSKRWLGLANSISDDEQEQLDAAYKKYTELHAEYKKAVDNYNLAVIESNRERQEQEAADAEASKQRAREVANAKIEEERRALAEIKKLYEDDRKERSEYWLNDLQLQQKRLDEWSEAEKDVVRNAYAKGLISEAEYLDQIFQIDLIYMDKKRKLDEQAAEWSVKYFEDTTTAFVEGEQTKQKKAEETAEKVTWATMKASEKYESMASVANIAFGQTVQLLNTLANTQDKTTKNGFEASKKMGIAAAAIQMLQGIISSWTSAMNPANAWMTLPGQIALGTSMTAFTTALGIAQINSIKKQTFDGGGSGASTATAMPSVNTAALMSSPINYTTEVKGAQAEEVIPQRIYVVESDITSTQTKVKTVEEESTF